MIRSPRELNELIRKGQLSAELIESIVQDALSDGRILTRADIRSSVPIFAGGTNFCPNSDFSYSIEAWNNNPPSTVAADYKKCYAAFVQDLNANIGTSLISDEADTDHPIWDLNYGVARIGTDDPAKIQDLAMKLPSVLVKPKDRWYLRAALATIDSTPLPDGSVFYMGFWIIKNDATQGWLGGDSIVLTYKRHGIDEGATIEYFLVGRLDTGYEVKSNVLTVTDGPNVLSDENYIELNFEGTAGFTQVDLYRKKAGVTHQIAHITNSAQLHHHDKGGFIIPVADFPVVSITALQAYGEVAPFALPITQSKTFANFTVNVPNFDETTISQLYVRMGIKAVAAIDRQLLIDTVWCSKSFNIWTPAFNDNPLGSPPTTQQTTGTPSDQTPYEPPSGGSSCVINMTDMLLPDDEWGIFNDATRGIAVESGDPDVPNIVELVRRSIVSELYVVRFEEGLIIFCTESHRFIRSFEDGTGVAAKDVAKGDTYQGRNTFEHKNIMLTIASIGTVYVKAQKVVALKIKERKKWTPYYAGGDRNLGLAAFFHNSKILDNGDVSF